MLYKIVNINRCQSFQSFIKEEPEDIASDVDEMDNVDPTQFLAQENDEEMEHDEHPPILASLGLTHISHSVSLTLNLFVGLNKTNKFVS